jgi:hypothetical protein
VACATVVRLLRRDCQPAPHATREPKGPRLYNFCAQTNCTDRAQPQAGLIADANGDLFGTTAAAGPHEGGTVFEITGSGFVSPAVFRRHTGTGELHRQIISALARQYGGLADAAAVLGYSSVQDFTSYCEA